MKKEYNKSILRIRNKILDENDDMRIEFIKENNLIYLPIPNDVPDTDYEFDIENLERNSEKFDISNFIMMCKDTDVDSDRIKELEKHHKNVEIYSYIVESKCFNTDFWPILRENYSHVLFFDLGFKFIGMTSCNDYRVYASSREILECVTGKTIEESIKELREFFTPIFGEDDPRYRKIMDVELPKFYESMANYK